MSVHPSLKGKGKAQDRTVLNRLEKLKKLKEEGKWEEGASVLGLPKVKTLRIKIKKEKAEKADAAATGAEGAAPAAGAPAGEKKAADAAKSKTEGKGK